MLGNGDVRISYVVAGETVAALPQRRRRRVRLRRGRHRRPSRRCSARCRSARATTWCSRARSTHRWVPAGAEPLRCYAIEANSHIAPPKRYLSRFGQLLEHAPYCERDLHGPASRSPRDGTDVEVLVKHRGSRGIAGTRLRRPPTRSTSSAGTAASTPTRSTSTTSSRSPAGCTSRRRCTRSSRARTSWSATSCRARSTTTRCRSRCPTTTPTSTPTRSCSTSAATTRPAAARASGRARSACTRAATPTARSPARSSARSACGGFDELAVMVDTFRPLELGEAGRRARRRRLRLDLVGPRAGSVTCWTCSTCRPRPAPRRWDGQVPVGPSPRGAPARGPRSITSRARHPATGAARPGARVRLSSRGRSVPVITGITRRSRPRNGSGRFRDVDDVEDGSGSGAGT